MKQQRKFEAKRNNKIDPIFSKDNLPSFQQIFTQLDFPTVEFKNVDTFPKKPPHITNVNPNQQPAPNAVKPTVELERSKGKIEITFPETKDMMVVDRKNCKVQIDLDSSCQIRPYKFMNENLKQIVQVLDENLTKLGQVWISTTKPETTRNDFYHTFQDSGTAIGRICCESAEGKLNEASVILEASCSISSSKRAKLHVRDLPEFSLFPGQIVAVECSNPTGKLLIPTKIFDGIKLPFYHPTEQEMKSFDAPLIFLVACGPWTSHDSLDPLPAWNGVVEQVKNLKPHVLILSGPFVDEEHPWIKENHILDPNYEKPFNELFSDFMEIVTASLKTLETDPALQDLETIVIPSLRDINHYCIFPQPPFQFDSTKLKFFPNPSIMKVNGVTIAISTNDILKHLSSQSITKPLANPMVKSCEHILKQRSLYPLCPSDISAQLDFCHMKQFQLPYTPDILILPSVLHPFVKDVESVLCINPGFVMQARAFGRCSTFTIHPRQENRPIIESTQVQIIHI